RVFCVCASAMLMAFNINTFVQAGGVLPGGFTGLAILIKEIALKFTGIELPFGVMLIMLNAVPAIISFRAIGKWFSVFSCLNFVLCGLFTDWMPPVLTDFLKLEDPLLSAVFGGILNAIAVNLCLNVDATTGGTDFIAIYFSERQGKDVWNYILVGNCVILVLAAFLFSPEKALYSIIFQYTSTTALTSLYRGYQQKTLLIITDKPEEVYMIIRDRTNHDATSFTGIGRYLKTERVMLYSVVSANDVTPLISAIKDVDPKAFINTIRTEQLTGSFYRRPKN
ncbi:MAG: YitT family protein, partial [Spirochaetaceae bacterium]|nr:YitT family protein [Spirochaetaceae bacterium]